jgi:anti-sigma regulatory factor (Ser/Thr protein kinase)
VAVLSLTFPPNNECGRTLRLEVRDWCTAESLSTNLCEDTLLTVSELFSNAARASVDEHEVLIRVAATRDNLTIEVENTGPGFDLASLKMPSPTQHGGRGVAITQMFGSVNVEQQGHQTTVRVQITREGADS